MEEGQKINKSYDKIRFDTLNRVEAFLEIDWNDTAFKEDLLKITIKGDNMIISREDLESLLLVLTKDPTRYLRASYQKTGIKYQPVPDSLYQKYLDRKKWIEKQKRKRSQSNS